MTVGLVTIDLAGFVIDGSNSPGTGIIAPTVFTEGTAVRNGTITGFEDGLDLTLVRSAIVEHVRAVDNNDMGIRAGLTCILTGNIVESNGNAGIRVGNGCVITNNTARNHGLAGIEAVGFGSTFIGNSASGNGTNGFAGGGSTFTGPASTRPPCSAWNAATGRSEGLSRPSPKSKARWKTRVSNSRRKTAARVSA